jgi:hypothetical protein
LSDFRFSFLVVFVSLFGDAVSRITYKRERAEEPTAGAKTETRTASQSTRPHRLRDVRRHRSAQPHTQPTEMASSNPARSRLRFNARPSLDRSARESRSLRLELRRSDARIDELERLLAEEVTKQEERQFSPRHEHGFMADPQRTQTLENTAWQREAMEERKRMVARYAARKSLSPRGVTTQTSYATMAHQPPTITRIVHTGDAWFFHDGWLKSTPRSHVADLSPRAPADPHCSRDEPSQTWFTKVFPGRLPLDRNGGSGIPGFVPLLPSR